MNRRYFAILLALALVGIAAIAWAADAHLQSGRSVSHEARVSAGADDDAPMVLGAAEDDGEDLEVMLDDASPPGDDGERRVIVRRFADHLGGLGIRGMGMGMRMGMDHSRHAGMMALMASRLDLNEMQRAKLRDIHERQQRHDIQARADLEIGRLDLRKALHADRPDASVINGQIDKLSRMRADMAKSHVAAMLEGRGVLTPEQQKKMREMHERGAMMGGMGPGGGQDGMRRGMGMGPGGRGMRGMGPGDPKVHVHIERDTLGGDSD